MSDKKANRVIWDALSKTDPKYTKLVTFGRKFTSINSQWQLQRMTEQFGPIGKGWGYEVQHGVERITEDYVLAVADVALWWSEGGGKLCYGPVRGMSPIVERGKNGLHYDDDAGKKAMTDALTKGLSHIGLSADVFLGLFDDNKYVREVAEEFANAEHPLPPEDRGLMTNGSDDTRSQYTADKQKAAEAFVSAALNQFAHMDSAALADWYRQPTSPKGKSTNRDAVGRLGENFPDLHARLETAAEEVRLRGPILQ